MALDLPHATRGFSVADLSPEGQRNHITGRALVARHLAQQSAREAEAAAEAVNLRFALAQVLPYAQRWGAIESGRAGFPEYAAAIAAARVALGLAEEVRS